ncbi:MAG: DUF4258 domain-containing protein [Desulfococcaceae bacterium]
MKVRNTEENKTYLSIGFLKKLDKAEPCMSCLVAGFANSGKPVHIVCGKFDGDLAIITVYIPAPPKFRNLYERG